MRGKAIKDWKKAFFNTIFILIFPLLFYTFIILLDWLFIIYQMDFRLLNIFTPKYFFQFILILAYFPTSFWLLYKYNNYDFVRPIIREVFGQIPLFIIVLSLIASVFLIFTGYNASFSLDFVGIILLLFVFFIILLYPFFQIKELNLLKKLTLMIKMELLANVIAFAFSPVVVIYQAVFEHEETDIVTSLIFLAIIVLLLIINFFLWYAIRRLERIKYSIKASIIILFKESVYIIRRIYYFIGVFFIPVGAIWLFHFLINDIFTELFYNNSALLWLISGIRQAYSFIENFGNGTIPVFVLYIYIYIYSRYNIFTFHNAEINNFKVFLREDPAEIGDGG
ncbi:hypothetical protein KAU32_11900 [bacterium]|nr:hypothetical protein [bacterium]